MSDGVAKKSLESYREHVLVHVLPPMTKQNSNLKILLKAVVIVALVIASIVKHFPSRYTSIYP